MKITITISLIFCVLSLFAQLSPNHYPEIRERLSPKYDRVGAFHKGGIVEVMQYAHYSFLKTDGTKLTDSLYSEADTFRQGLAAVRNKNGWGFLDEKGKEVIPCQYEDINGGFCLSIALVQKDNKWGAIRKDGTLAIPFVYDDMQLIVQYTPQTHKDTVIITKQFLPIFWVKQNNKWGMIDTDNKFFIPCEYDKYEPLNAPREVFFRLHKGENIGLFDNKGNNLIPVKYSYLGRFFMNNSLNNFFSDTDIKDHYDRYFIAALEGKTKWGLLDRKGEVKIPFEYDNQMQMELGNAYIHIQKNGKDGLMDTNFQVIIPCDYNKISPKGDFFIAENEKQKALFDLNGKLICPLAYQDFTMNEQFIARETEDSVALLDKKGKYLIPLQDKYTFMRMEKDLILARIVSHYDTLYDTVRTNLAPSVHNSGVFKSYCGKDSLTIHQGLRAHYLYGYIDSSGKEVLPFVHKDKYSMQKGEYIVRKNGKFGLKNIAGKDILPCKFDTIYTAFPFYNEDEWGFGDGYSSNISVSSGDDFWVVGKNGKYGLIAANNKGKYLIPIEYEEIKNFDIDIRLTDASLDDSYFVATDKQGRKTLYNTKKALFRADARAEIIPQQQEWFIFDKKGFEVYDSTGKKRADFSSKDSIRLDRNNRNWEYYIYKKTGELCFWQYKKGKYALVNGKKKPVVPYYFDKLIAGYGYNQRTVAALRQSSPNTARFTMDLGLEYPNAREISPFYKYEEDTLILGKDKRFLCIHSQNSYRLLDKKKQIILPEKYKSIAYLAEQSVFILETNRQKAVIDTSGKALTPSDCEQTYIYDNILYVQNGLYGINDKKGKEILPAVATEIETKIVNANNIPLLNNRYIVTINDKKGLLDATGKWLIPAIYDDLSVVDFKHLVGVVNDKVGLFDSLGKPITPFHYPYFRSHRSDYSTDISNDIYKTKFQLTFLGENLVLIPINDDNSKLVDMRTGKEYPFEVLLEQTILRQAKLFIFRTKTDTWIFNLNGDYKGKIPYQIAEESYYIGRKDKNDVLLCTFTYSKEKKIKENYGLIDTNAVQIVANIYQDIRPFAYNRAVMKQENKYGIIDTKGKVIVEPQYEAITTFDIGGYAVITKDKKQGVIDTSGKIIIPVMYDAIANRQENELWSAAINNKCGLINTKNEAALAFDYEGIILEHEGYIRFQKECLWGLMDKNQKVIFPAQFDFIQCNHYKHTFIITASNKMQTAWQLDDSQTIKIVTASSLSFNRIDSPLVAIHTSYEVAMAVWNMDLHKLVTPFVYRGQFRKKENHFILEKDDENGTTTRGIYSYEGKELIACEWSKITEITDTKANHFYLLDHDVLLDKHFEVLMKGDSSEIFPIWNGKELYFLGNKQLFQYQKTPISFPFTPKELNRSEENFREDYICFKEGDLYGFANFKGEITIKPIFEEVVKDFKNGYAVIRKNHVDYVINQYGDIVGEREE